MARISLSELRNRASTVDRAKADAITDADILTQRALDPDAPSEMPANARNVEPPKALRVRLGMTQPEMAAALGIPVGTWRNWEQGRVRLDPAAHALLRIISRAPEVALAALSPTEAGTEIVAVVSERVEEVRQRLVAEADARHTSMAIPLAVRGAATADDLLRALLPAFSTRHG